MTAERVAKAVEEWARDHIDKLPWRTERDLYRLILAEVLLKRTTRKAAARTYPRFVERFPTVDDLCKAGVEEIEELLKPVGLYRQRAKHLAQLCQHLDVLKRASSWRDLVKLPGVGEYTAKVIGAVLFGERVLGVDGNVKRLLTRVFGHYNEKTADALAQASSDTRLLQLGLVDLGYRVCHPRRPKCSACPLADICSFKSTLQLTE